MHFTKQVSAVHYYSRVLTAVVSQRRAAVVGLGFGLIVICKLMVATAMAVSQIVPF